MKKISDIVIVMITAFFLFGNSTSNAPAMDKPDHNDKRGTLRFGIHVSEIGSLDPHLAAGSQDRAIADMLFNGLLRYRDGNAPKIEPDLAESIPEPRHVKGIQIWTFKLKKGVMFHPFDGSGPDELTADDVVFSFNKSANPKYSSYAGEYEEMIFEKVDNYTVNIILRKPMSPILFFPKVTNYAGGFIVSKNAIEAKGYEYFKKHPVGTGPFMFDSYEPKEKILLIANDRYFKGKPELKGVEFHLLPDIKDRENALNEGRLDAITGSGDREWIDKISKAKNVVLDIFGVGEVMTIHLNVRKKPFDNILVRQAIFYVLDRNEFLKSTSDLLAEKVSSPVPVQLLPGGISEREIRTLGLDYDVDVVKARKLMSQAGYPNGFAVTVISSEKRIYRENYEILKEQLKKIHIDCYVEVVNHGEMQKRIRKGESPIVIYGAWRPNADVFLTRFFHSDSIVVTGKTPDTNFSSYDKIDKLIEAAREEIAPDKQIQLWMQSQIKILSDAAAYPVFFTNQCFARRSDVDYGHPLKASMALYPQITEKTRFLK
ncbi:MAG: ABC transporter substrate-binding protein [Pseudomonadota bacterium]